MTRKNVFLGVAFTMLTSAAQAATMTASLVTVDPDVTPSGVTPSVDPFLAAQTVRVVSGADGDIDDNVFFDVNAGINGDQFDLSASSVFSQGLINGSFVSWTVTGLEFAGNQQLRGLTILTDFGNSVISNVTGSSFTLTYEDNAIPQGLFFSARYDTGFASVPLPASSVLLGAGLMGLGAVARRRRKTAA